MNNYFIGSSQKNPTEYLCGENMHFILTYVDENRNALSCPVFKWKIMGDDGVQSEGRCSGESGIIELDASISLHGFVRVMVYACDADGNQLPDSDMFEGGAGAELDKITRGEDEPADFDAVWDVMLAELDAVPVELLEKIEVASDNERFFTYDVKIKAPGSMPASGYLTIPKTEGKYALRLSFSGYGYASAPKVYAENRISLHVNPHGYENGREPEYYENMQKNVIPAFGFSDSENQSVDTCYFKYMMLRDLAALRWARTLPQWNGSETYIVGGSMGAMQTVNVAAHADNITAIEINVPWFCDLGGITKGRIRGWRPNLTPAVRYFDTANNAAHLRCPVTVVNAGLGDYVCPPSGITAMYNSIKTPKKIEYGQNRKHGYTPPTYDYYRRSHGLEWQNA